MLTWTTEARSRGLQQHTVRRAKRGEALRGHARRRTALLRTGRANELLRARGLRRLEVEPDIVRRARTREHRQRDVRKSIALAEHAPFRRTDRSLESSGLHLLGDGRRRESLLTELALIEGCDVVGITRDVEHRIEGRVRIGSLPKHAADEMRTRRDRQVETRVRGKRPRVQRRGLRRSVGLRIGRSDEACGKLREIVVRRGNRSLPTAADLADL